MDYVYLNQLDYLRQKSLKSLINQLLIEEKNIKL